MRSKLVLSVPERSEGTEVAKIDVRGGVWGGFPPPFEGRHPPGRREGGFGGFYPPFEGPTFTRAKSRGDQPRRLSVCPLRGELVRAGLTDRDETFGGDIWHCQERISLKPARSVEIWVVRRLKKWF